MAREPPALSDYGAHLALLVPQNTWALAALLSANINMMRRHAVFAYLFAVGYSLQLWREEVIGEDDYKNSRDAIELRRGLWLGYPERKDQPRTLVIAILEGDVTPIAQLLDGERCALLCLPRYRSLTEDAPYAYLFATTFSLDAWQEEIEDLPYLRTMDTIQLRRGVSLYDPEWEGTASTVVTAVLQGDVIEEVHFLGQEEFTLLCLPFYRSLTQLRRDGCECSVQPRRGPSSAG